MYDLANFHEDDVNDSPSQEGWGSPSWYGGGINWFYFIGWLVNISRSAHSVESRRAKLRKLREEVLPRAPKTIVCPQCFEVIERF